MSVTVILVFIVLGIVLLLVEFLVVPGVTIVGIAGTLLIVGGVVCGYVYQEPPVSHYIALVSAAIIISIFVFAFKTKTWQRFGLKTTIDSHAPSNEIDFFNVGDIGKTISRLAPIGKVMINEKITEARSMGGYIDSNKDIIVIKTEKNKIFVEPKIN